MEHTEFQEFRDKQLRKLKVWKAILIVHGVNLFLLVYLAIINMITSGYSFLEYFKELFDELVNYPTIFISYVTLSVVLNIFTIPRLIALYRFIEAVILGERKVKHALFYVLAALLEGVILIFGLSAYLTTAHASKPIIYLYPESRTEVDVRLALDGKLTVTYPDYDLAEGWIVTAEPDGTLTDKKGRQYSYLYWEGDISIKPDLSTGFCVKGEDTAKFLETALAELGLNDKEADDFITYWLPEMMGNKYNVITFQTKAYEDVASLNVSPKPDTVIRVNMLWYSSDRQVSIRPQDLKSVNPSERKGFTVVEWGGEEYKKAALN